MRIYVPHTFVHIINLRVMKNDIHIEPVLSELDFKELECSSIIKIEECIINLTNEIVLIAKQNNVIVGIIQLKPILQNAMTISICEYHYKTDALKLLIEALKYAWELNYDVIFSDADGNLLEKVGFVAVNSKYPYLNTIDPNLYAYSLTYQGIEKFYSSVEPQLN